jgi:hypothetical protein
MPPNQKSDAPLNLSTHEAPKHFVRTLESDTEALKKGTKPGFAEVGQEPVPDKVPELPPLPPPPPPLPQFHPPPSPQPLKPVEPAHARLIEGSTFPTFAPPQKPKPPPQPQPPPPPPPQSEAPLRTYTNDFETHLDETRSSNASVLAAESDARKNTPRSSTVYNLPLIIGGVVFILLGSLGGYGTYHYLSKQSIPVLLTPTIEAPIFVNEREQITGSGSGLIEAIESSISNPLAANAVRLLYTSAATSTTRDVFRALKLQAPNVLLRNIETEGSMSGVVNAGGINTLFFILRVSSYGDTFAGMLAWEPRMQTDLSIFYPATTTGSNLFQDEVLESHDIRVLRDISGASIVLYGYINPSTLLIAADEKAYQEILDRLVHSRTTH